MLCRFCQRRVYIFNSLSGKLRRGLAHGPDHIHCCLAIDRLAYGVVLLQHKGRGVAVGMRKREGDGQNGETACGSVLFQKLVHHAGNRVGGDQGLPGTGNGRKQPAPAEVPHEQITQHAGGSGMPFMIDIGLTAEIRFAVYNLPAGVVRGCLEGFHPQGSGELWAFSKSRRGVFQGMKVNFPGGVFERTAAAASGGKGKWSAMKNEPGKMSGAAGFVLAVICLLLVAGGCGSLKSPPRKIYFHTLEYPPPTFAKRPRLSASLRVESFQTSPDYTSRQIIYREADFSRQAYVYHKWHSAPASMLSYLFMRDLGRCGLFAAVAGPGQPLVTPYAVSGMVDQFLEEDAAAGRFAVLSVTLTLTHTGGHTPSLVLQKHYEIRRPIEGREAVDVVRAMSQAASQFSRQAIEDIYAALAETDHREAP